VLQNRRTKKYSSDNIHKCIRTKMRLPIPSFVNSIPYDKLISSRDKKNKPTINIQLNKSKKLAISLDNMDRYPFSPPIDSRKLYNSRNYLQQPHSHHSRASSTTRPQPNNHNQHHPTRYSRQESRNRKDGCCRSQLRNQSSERQNRRSKTVPPKRKPSIIGCQTTSFLLIIWTLMCLLHDSHGLGE